MSEYELMYCISSGCALPAFNEMYAPERLMVCIVLNSEILIHHKMKLLDTANKPGTLLLNQLHYLFNTIRTKYLKTKVLLYPFLKDLEVIQSMMLCENSFKL